MAVNWAIGQNQVNPLAMFQQGMQQGRQQRAERQADEAFKAYQSNPDDQGAINALLMADPDRGRQALQIRQLQRDESLRNALMGAYDPNTGSLDPSKAKQAYIGAGDVQGAMNIDKTAREAQKAQLEQGLKQVEAIGQLVGSVTDQATYTAAVERAKALGIDVGEVPAQYDPAYVAGLQKQAIDAKGQIELAAKERGFALDVAKFDETRRSNQARESISAGQLGVAQANLGLRQAELGLKTAEAMAGGKAPAGYVWKPDGSLAAIHGGPADPKNRRKETNIPATVIEKLSKDAEATQTVSDLRASFQPTYSGIGSGIGNLAGRMGLGGADTKAQADWWQRMESFDNVIRNSLFGSALTATEQAAWKRTTVTPNMAASRIKANLAERERILSRALNRKANSYKAGGYAADAIDAVVRIDRPAKTATAASKPDPLGIR